MRSPSRLRPGRVVTSSLACSLGERTRRLLARRLGDGSRRTAARHGRRQLRGALAAGAPRLLLCPSPAMRTTSTSRPLPSSVSIGLALLLATLALPLTALSQARGLPLGPAAAGAFVAYLLHAAADWDWEMPVVTLSALFCAAVLLASQRPADSVRLTGSRRVVALSNRCARARCRPRRACRQPSHSGQQRRDRAWRARSCARPRATGDPLGPVVARALAASRGGRALRPG